MSSIPPITPSKSHERIGQLGIRAGLPIISIRNAFRHPSCVARHA